MDPLLALDIGNGSIKFALFEEGRPSAHGRLPLDADLAELPEAPHHAAVSVNPPVLARVRARLAGVQVFGEEIPVPVPVRYDPPSDCGLDRVAGVVGAFALHPDADSVLLLDLGTCLTATIGVRGVGVVGGAILPGAEMMAASLAEKTAALPHVDPTTTSEPIGRSTEASIRAGIQAALAGAARELVSRFQANTKETRVVVAAGTGAEFLGRNLHEVDAVHTHATLFGVYIAARP